jgi:hypothetical protein
MAWWKLLMGNLIVCWPNAVSVLFLRLKKVGHERKARA